MYRDAQPSGRPDPGLEEAELVAEAKRAAALARSLEASIRRLRQRVHGGTSTQVQDLSIGAHHLRIDLEALVPQLAP